MDLLVFFNFLLAVMNFMEIFENNLKFVPNLSVFSFSLRSRFDRSSFPTFSAYRRGEYNEAHVQPSSSAASSVDVGRPGVALTV